MLLSAVTMQCLVAMLLAHWLALCTHFHGLALGLSPQSSFACMMWAATFCAAFLLACAQAARGCSVVGKTSMSTIICHASLHMPTLSATLHWLGRQCPSGMPLFCINALCSDKNNLIRVCRARGRRGLPATLPTRFVLTQHLYMGMASSWL